LFLEHGGAIGVYDPEYHLFFSVGGWDPDGGDCIKEGIGGTGIPENTLDRQCCGSD